MTFELRGFGLTLRPRWPRFMLTRPGSIAVAAVIPGELGSEVVTIDPALPAGVAKLADEGVLEQGPAHRRWVIAAPGFSVPWPDDLRLLGTKPGAPWAFELYGSRADALIFCRGPLRGAGQVPAPPDLVAPGQQVVADGMGDPRPWLELEYDHEGVTFRQRHIYAVPEPETVVLVTAQAPADAAGSLMAAAMEIAAGVELA